MKYSALVLGMIDTQTRLMDTNIRLKLIDVQSKNNLKLPFK